jgi:putative membrane protein
MTKLVIKISNEWMIMKRSAWNKIVLAAGLCAFAVPVFGDDMNATNPPTPPPVMSPADFVWDASLINLKEIRLGEAAQTNSQNAEVQEFGKHMVRDHSRLNARLVKIAADEGLTLPDTNTFYVPVTPPAEKQATQLLPETPQQKLLDAQVDVQNLVSLSGPDFDQAYASAMVRGHEKAIQKFEDASASLQDESLKKFADRGLRTIRGHYEMAQKLQSEVETNSVPGTMTNSSSNM